ncbi:hypothetical protein HPP92_018951 [Vanilla planifolia]|uniref:SBP-type domain-containing protein n=1 Tax=Vanilla planifolia TaxID=51239 RepID=A0A835QAU9_VANPL|nr:hypothetical protein HPP92_018951 [Vanilla planifolia]
MGGGGSSSKSVAPPAVPAALPSQPPPPLSVKKGKGPAQGGGQPPPPARCQVEGCDLDLTGAKSYYRRHKVCGMHSKHPKVIVAGLEQRFCQQCSRFHLLAEFDQGKRSCRRRLAGHNERRRKPSLGQSLASFHEPNGRYGGGILMNFMHPKPPDSARVPWSTMSGGDRAPNRQSQRRGFGNPGVGMAVSSPYPTTVFSSPEISPGDCFAGVAESTCALSLLSTQPWCTASVGPRIQRSPVLLSGDEFDMAGGYVDGSWADRDHAGGGKSQGMGWREIRDGGVCQFSGELELAVRGSRHCPTDGVGPSQAYDHHHDVNWSL